MMMIYRRRENIVARKIGDDLLLVPIRGKLADMQKLIVLEGVGDFIWQKLDGSMTVDMLRDAVAAEFDVVPEQAARDIEDFIVALKNADLLAEVA